MVIDGLEAYGVLEAVLLHECGRHLRGVPVHHDVKVEALRKGGIRPGLPALCPHAIPRGPFAPGRRCSAPPRCIFRYDGSPSRAPTPA